MAIFTNNDSKHQGGEKSTSTTIITIGSKITGEINLECNLYIDGEVDGTITSSKEITIGQNGVVRGEISAKHLVVNGKAEGNINVDIVEIKPNGVIVGTVESTQLIIEKDGFFEGNSIKKTASHTTTQTHEDISKS